MTAEHDTDKPVRDRLPSTFPTLGVLFSRVDLWPDWLKQEPQRERGDMLLAAVRWVVRLSSHTGWSEAEVLAHIGCDTKTEEELNELSDAKLRQSIDFMSWVESLLGDLDVASDKRLAVSGATRFFASAEMDLDSCKQAMSSGDFTALEYLRLGEVAQAWQCAMRRLDNPRGERARQTQEDNPFIDGNTPHISPRRLTLLSHPDAQELLGLRVQAHIEEHLRYCPACANASERRLAVEAERRPLGGVPAMIA
jgi:hypothetical protein